MELKSIQVPSSDGRRLFCRVWEPENGPGPDAGAHPGGDPGPRGVLAFSHGLGDHSGRYQYLAEALSPIGVALVIADLRGHGQSPGKRGHVAAFREYLDDYAAAIRTARERFPGAGLLCGGHSLGGLIALGAAVEGVVPSDCRGLVISAPALAVGFEPPKWKVAAARGLSKIVPGALFSTGLDAEHLSHDPAVVESYEQDPLVHGKISARAYIETLRLQAITRTGAPDLSLPLLMLQGTDDRDVDPAATKTFFDAAASSDKTLKEYPGFYHEVFNEVGGQAALQDVVGWVGALL
jgi:alpha-beta hydrolase superfamily lysophospholipase